MKHVKTLLDSLYRECRISDYISRDPIEFPKAYTNPEDIEAAAFLSASLAYGKVYLFKPVIQTILTRLGKQPGRALSAFDVQRDAEHFRGISYRFNRNSDIIALLYVIHRLNREFGSIKGAFLNFFNGKLSVSLAQLIEYILHIDLSPVYGIHHHPRGFLHFFPSPQRGSACKRLNLFLRWMVRDRDVDFGLWPEIPRECLLIPLDTHIARIGRCLGLSERKSSDWKTAREITENLKKLDPHDPLKYDFALCHFGISRACSPHSDPSQCRTCKMNLTEDITSG